MHFVFSLANICNNFSLLSPFGLSDDSVRQDIGSKNVSLGNVIPASYKDPKTPFVTQSDKELMDKHRIPAFEVISFHLARP